VTVAFLRRVQIILLTYLQKTGSAGRKFLDRSQEAERQLSLRALPSEARDNGGK